MSSSSRSSSTRLGHAVTGQAFGERVRIVLHAFGGLTFRSGKLTSAIEDIAVSLAGSVTQILVLGLPAHLLLQSGAVGSFTWYVILYDVRWVSLGWAIVNLLPILPLDGRNIALTILRRARRIDAERVTRSISVGAALGLSIWAYHRLGLMEAVGAVLRSLERRRPRQERALTKDRAPRT